MLDLQPIKARLEMASPDKGRRVGYPPDADLKNHAYDDLAALVAEVERLTAENDSQEERICHFLDEADKRIDADIRQRNTSIGRPAETVRNIDRLQAEVERLRAAIEAHRNSLDTGHGLSDETDWKLWAVLDA